MALRITALIFGLSLATVTHAGELNEAQFRYQGAASCIDRLFFEDGYQEGDSAREKLITEFLTHHQLPGYDEALYSQDQAPDTDIDMQAYMAGYYLCSEDADYVTALGKRHGYQLPEE